MHRSSSPICHKKENRERVQGCKVARLARTKDKGQRTKDKGKGNRENGKGKREKVNVKVKETLRRVCFCGLHAQP